jgi:hypothetical protein
MRLLAQLVLVPLLVAASACQPQRKPGESAPAPIVAAPADRTSEIVKSEIQVLVSDRTCTTDADCALIPLGSNRCPANPQPGGHLAYSIARTDPDLLQQLITEYNTLFLEERQDVPPPSAAQCRLLLPEPAISCDKATYSCELADSGDEPVLHQ